MKHILMTLILAVGGLFAAVTTSAAPEGYRQIADADIPKFQQVLSAGLGELNISQCRYYYRGTLRGYDFADYVGKMTSTGLRAAQANGLKLFASKTGDQPIIKIQYGPFYYHNDPILRDTDPTPNLGKHVEFTFYSDADYTRLTDVRSRTTVRFKKTVPVNLFEPKVKVVDVEELIHEGSCY